MFLWRIHLISLLYALFTADLEKVWILSWESRPKNVTKVEKIQNGEGETISRDKKKIKCRLFLDGWGGDQIFRFSPKFKELKYRLDLDDGDTLVRFREYAVHRWVIYDVQYSSNISVIYYHPRGWGRSRKFWTFPLFGTFFCAESLSIGFTLDGFCFL